MVGISLTESFARAVTLLAVHTAAEQIVDMQTEETEARRRLQAMRDQIRAVKKYERSAW